MPDLALLAAISAGAGLIACLGTRALVPLLRRAAVLDRPNERSSHAAPTPRGGGIAVVAAILVAWLALIGAGAVAPRLIVICVSALLLAAVSWLDDLTDLSPAGRLLAQLVAVGLGMLAVVPEGPVFQGWLLPALDAVAAALLWLWFVNLFNFMDGIDGIAASEGVFIACSGALLSLVYGQASDALAAGMAFSAASLGFLLWNWPPATIFMGDVGSGYLGYVIAVIAVAATRDNPAAVWIWLILGGVFFVDATVTLLRRAVRRERLHEAHRCHAYQRLAQRWGSHRRITVAVILLNLGWLLPCALIAALYPQAAVWVAVGALAPLVVLALASGSGGRSIDS